MQLQCIVSYRENVLLLEFNEEMNIVGDNSVMNAINYAIDNGTFLNIIPSETVVESGDKKRIRLIVPYYFLQYLKPNNFINIGYINRKDIRYVENARGDIYDICSVLQLKTPVPQLNLSDGYGYLEESKSIYYKYTGENEFSEIFLQDFYASVNGAIKSPLGFIRIKENEFIFIFDNDSFKNNDEVYLWMYSNPKTRDIYGLPVKGDASLKIRTTPKGKLTTVSLSNIDNSVGHRAYLMLMFDESIKEFYADDFAAIYEGKLYSLVYSGENYMDRKVFEVWIDLGTYLTFPVKDITLFTNVPEGDIRTINYENIPIRPVIQNKARMFTANSLTWRVNDNSLEGNIIDIYFDGQIDCGTLITNSHFNSELVPWDGSEIIVPRGAIKFTKGASSDVLSLNFNPSFGVINVTPKSGTTFINGNITNSNVATIRNEGNKVAIIFSENESSEAYPMTIDTFKYKGTKLVMGVNNYLLCYGYEPVGTLLARDIIFVPPMNNSLDNPFKGGYQNPSYILKVDNNHSYRTYGNVSTKTVIGGFVRVNGPINNGQEVTLLNLNILGTLYVNLGSGNIILDSTDISSIIYE